MKPNIVITTGDPSGIGPEVALKSLASPKVSGLANFFVIGDHVIVDRLKKDMGLKLKHPLIDIAGVNTKKFSYGRVDPLFGSASIGYLDKAIELLMAGEADGLVTAPINKSSIISAGFRGFKGHTEYMAQKTGTKDFAMMFVGKSMKITLVTRHVALSDVARSLSVGAIERTIRLTHKYLGKFFKIANPKIGVAGLNPHAGENGLFGNEEKRLIIPAIKRVSRDIKGITGPVPPDVIFYEALNKKFDCVVAMYHDQALIPFKMLYFTTGVNMTLGLPFIRTSPDHGTAFDIAGKNKADPSSMTEAILLACRLCAKFKKPR